MKKVYQRIKVQDVDARNGKFVVLNKYFFTDLSGFAGSWRLEDGGHPGTERKARAAQYPARRQDRDLDSARPASGGPSGVAIRS